MLEKLVVLGLAADRYADAAAHLREALKTALRAGGRRKVIEDLDCCGYPCALTGRTTEAVTVRTVSSHLDRIRDKTGCRRRADLTRLALGAGLV